MSEQSILEKITTTLHVVGHEVGLLNKNQLSTRAYFPVRTSNRYRSSVIPASDKKIESAAKIRTQSIGMCEKTGKMLMGLEHLKQSLRNIILTEKFQRVMRRDYGSDLCERVDDKTTETHFLESYADLASIVEKWEPRFKLIQILIKAGESIGQFIYNFSGDFLGNNVEIGINA